MQNNKILKCPIFIIILLFIYSSFTGFTMGFSVDKSQIFTYGGNTLYVGGGGLGNYSNIQDAIDNSSDGDTVFVFDDSSPYYENLIITKGIFLIGENRDTTIIDGSGHSNVIYIDADSVYVSSFTIQNGGLIFPYGGINIRSNYSTISNNNLEKMDADDFQDTAQTDSDPLNTTLRKEFWHQFEIAMERLSKMEKEVFALRFMDQLGIKEISETLSRSESTVKTHLYRALAKVQQNTELKNLYGQEMT